MNLILSPTYLFLKNDGSVIMKSLGAMEAEEFKGLAKTAQTEMND